MVEHTADTPKPVGLRERIPMALELRFTIPGQVERVVPLDQPTMKIGALLSNQIVLRAPGVDPIHALMEEDASGNYVLTDLGSATGLKINGRLIDVEETLKEGDRVTIGSVVIDVQRQGQAQAAQVPVPGIPAAAHSLPVAPGATVKIGPDEQAARRAAAAGRPVEERPESDGDDADRKKDMLFSPRHAKPAGDVLECVAYWGDTVLEVELFHQTYKGYDTVTIGDPTKAHFIAAGKGHFDRATLASFDGGGFKLKLQDGMQARLRRGGKVEKMKDSGTVSLSSRDIAHVKYGAVSYFLMFVRPPSLNLPKSGPTDPFFLGISLFFFLIYAALVPFVVMHDAKPPKETKDDVWQIVSTPEKDKKPPKEKEQEKKPPIKLAEKKTPPKVPPKPKPKPPVQPAKPVEKEKPQQQKPVEKPVEKPVPTKVLTEVPPKVPTPQKAQEAKPNGPVTPNPEKSAGPKTPNPEKAAGPNTNLNKLKGVGMPSTGAKTPDFKLAGPTLANTALGKSGGPQGSGMNQKGAPIKGSGKADFKGVEGVNNNKASGVNLSKLGLGVGKIMNQSGGISTNFKSAAGGAGGGMGSASKTYGMGGAGSGKSLGLAGAGGAVNNFGSGAGGFLGGQGGSGGNGGAGLAGAFGGGGGGGGGGAGGPGGHGKADVTLPPGDPVMTGGLTSQEIMAVIRANLNQIRHCYEQLLQRSPNAAGKMSVMFVVGLGGRVQAVSVTDSSISDSMMRGCVTGKIQRWAFPKPRGGQPVTVNYPFVFNPL